MDSQIIKQPGTCGYLKVHGTNSAQKPMGYTDTPWWLPLILRQNRKSKLVCTVAHSAGTRLALLAKVAVEVSTSYINNVRGGLWRLCIGLCITRLGRCSAGPADWLRGAVRASLGPSAPAGRRRLPSRHPSSMAAAGRQITQPMSRTEPPVITPVVWVSPVCCSTIATHDRRWQVESTRHSVEINTCNTS